VRGKATTFEVIGSDDAREKTARHAQAIIDDPTLNRVTCYLKYKYKARQLDPDDELKVVADPKSAYVQTALSAMRRAMDDAIIASIYGTKYTGENGTTSSALPSAQKITESGTDGITLDKILTALEKFNDNDVDEYDQKFLAIGPKQLTDMLSIDKLTAADYQQLKALVPGRIAHVLGFNIIMTTRLSISSSKRLCLAWAKSGVGLAIGADITAAVKQGDIKDHLSWQSYVRMFVGATRIEDEKVVTIECHE